MTRNVEVIGPDATLEDAASRMGALDIGRGLPVTHPPTIEEAAGARSCDDRRPRRGAARGICRLVRDVAIIRLNLPTGVRGRSQRQRGSVFRPAARDIPI